MAIPCAFLIPSDDPPGSVDLLGDCTKRATCVALVHGLTIHLCNECANFIQNTGDDDAKVLRDLPTEDS